MRIEFIERDEPGLVAEVEVYFEASLPKPFAGKKLVGTQLRSRRDGSLYVNLPGRAFGAGSTRQYFEYLRDENEHHSSLGEVKRFILDEWDKSEPIKEER